MKIRKKIRETKTPSITIKVDFGDGDPDRVKVKAVTRDAGDLVAKAIGADPEASPEEVREADARLMCRSVVDPDTGEPIFDEEEDLEYLAEGVPAPIAQDGWHRTLSEAITYVNGWREEPPTGYRDERYDVIVEKTRQLRGALGEIEMNGHDHRVEAMDLLDQIEEFASEGGDLAESISTAAHGLFDLAGEMYADDVIEKPQSEQLQNAVDGIDDVASDIAGSEEAEAYSVKKT